MRNQYCIGPYCNIALGQYCNTALGQYWFLICISLRPKWEAIPVLPRAHIQGQYWDLFQRGPVTLAPGQYWLLWHAWKLKSRVLTNVRTIPPQSKRRRQHGKILSPPLGLGGYGSDTFLLYFIWTDGKLQTTNSDSSALDRWCLQIESSSLRWNMAYP